MRSILLTLSACLLSWSAPRQTIAPVNFLEMDLNDVRELAGRDGYLYFAYFTADWCAPCQWMNDHTFQEPELSHYVALNYLAVKVDIDNWKSRMHQEQFKVKMLPSILVFNAQGQLLEKIESSISGTNLLQILEKHNLPKNRLGSAPASPGRKESIMDSPKPALQAYRPPLQAAPPAPSLPKPAPDLPPPVVIPAPASRPASPGLQPRPAEETLAPRSEAKYRIQVASHEDYDRAIRQVGQLEAGFKEPVHIMGEVGENGKQVYHIYIGQFNQKKAAEEFLYYLRRKNISGHLQELR